MQAEPAWQTPRSSFAMFSSPGPCNAASGGADAERATAVDGSPQAAGGGAPPFPPPPAVDVVDLCGSEDSEASPATSRLQGKGASECAPTRCDDSDDVIIVEASDYTPEQLARWDAESRQRQARRHQRRVNAAQDVRASDTTVPGLTGPSSNTGLGVQALDAAWGSVAADWRRKNTAAVLEEPTAARTRDRSAAAPMQGSSPFDGGPGMSGGIAGQKSAVDGPGARRNHTAEAAMQSERACGADRDATARLAAWAEAATGSTHVSEQDARDKMRSWFVSELRHRCRGCFTLGEVLHALGCTPDGWPLSTESQLRAAYRAAALKYHPDRSQGEPLASRVRNEEIFKLLSTVKQDRGMRML